MFRQAKSAFIWYHLYKFRRTFVLIAFLLSIVLFSQWIYSDIVEYLQLRKHLEYLDYILPIKWAIILFNITLSIYLFFSLFKNNIDKKNVKDEKSDRKNNHKKKDEEEAVKDSKKEKFTNREKEFLYKKDLNSQADSLLRK